MFPKGISAAICRPGPGKSISRRHNASYWLLLSLAIVEAGCVSHRHRPDPAMVVDSPGCEIVNGAFVVRSAEDGKLLAESLFDADAVISSLRIEKNDSVVSFHGLSTDGPALPAVHFVRTACKDSILRVVLDDRQSADAIFMAATDRVADLFSTVDRTLSIRFASTTIAFFYIIPYYGSSDRLVTLERDKDPPE